MALSALPQVPVLAQAVSTIFAAVDEILRNARMQLEAQYPGAGSVLDSVEARVAVLKQTTDVQGIYDLLVSEAVSAWRAKQSPVRHRPPDLVG